jgi:hypothetical protein
MSERSNERKQRLHDKFIATLDHLDKEAREPDRWEEECLFYTLSALASGLYLVAEVELEAFVRPPAERSPEAVAALEARPRRFTKDLMRRVLERLMERGPISSFEVLPTADQLEALGRARLFVLEQEVGDERVGLALPSEGRGLSVPGHELDVVAQRP